MRLNKFVIEEEVEIPDGAVLVSKTDLFGKITFANSAFVTVSGYSAEELVGAPHNVVRHPHMPREAFADLWQTIKSGKPWDGLVKNRCKDGRYYWVRANVTPLIENGQVVGYISIRTKPPRQQVSEAETLYRAIREGQAREAGPTATFLSSFCSIRVRLAALFLVSAAGACGATLAALTGLGWLAGAITLLTVPGSALLARASARASQLPLKRMEGHFEAIARNDLSHQIERPSVREFGPSIDMLRAMRARLAYAALEGAETQARSETALKNEIARLSGLLQTEIRQAVGDIFEQVGSLSAAAVHLAGIAEQLAGRAQAVSQSIDTTAGNMQTVAGATEELEASSRAITAQVIESGRMAVQGREKVAIAGRRMSGLSDASRQIGSMVALIRSIAGQTKMLALNATIEAVRAGEAGAGFHVVALEVKGLSAQTEQGIAQVSAQSEQIGVTTGEAVAIVQEVADNILRIDAITGEVARAADEQRAATAEIMRSAAQAAEHTQLVAHAMSDMVEGVRATGRTATQVRELSASLSDNVDRLRRRLLVILDGTGGSQPLDLMGQSIG